MVKSKSLKREFFFNRIFRGKKGMAGDQEKQKDSQQSTDKDVEELKSQVASLKSIVGGKRQTAQEIFDDEQKLKGLRSDAEKADERKEKKKEKKEKGWRQRSKEFLRGEWEDAGKGAGGWMFILLTVLLYMFDIFFRYNGLNIQRFLDNLYFTSIESYIGWFFNSIVLTLLIAYYVIYRPKPQEFISWFLVAETLSLIIFMGGMGTALIHLSFVIAFYFLYIRYSSEDKASANYIFFFLLAFDFFGFGLLAEFVKNPIISNRLIIPIWFYFALIYTHEKERTFWINLVIIIVILMNVFYFVGGINGLRSMSATLTEEEKQEGINFIRTGWKNVRDTFSRAIEGFRADLEAQLTYASGGYYKGRVERNKIGPLGVFIDKLKASQPRYYEEEDAIVWGTIKALSLGEGINVKVDCHKKGEEKYASRVVPKHEEQPFTMYSRETRDFECVFEYSETPWFSDFGIHTITADAEFNFGTLAYLKSYFMDIERKRSMVREGLDPFKEFGIKDTEPVAVYTDGPVIIGMETTSPIIEVGEGMVTQPRIGVTLENKEGWEGKIRNITELVLLTPPRVIINLEDEDHPCTVKFKKYTKDDCEKKSCVNFVEKPCKQVCGHKKGAAETSCLSQCAKNLKNCKDDCKILFEGEKREGKVEDYNGYTLDTSKIDVRNMFKDIDRYRSFSCRLTAKTEEGKNVLGNTPITVKYFRAKARYDYVISKDIDIQVQSEAGTAVDVSRTIDTTGLIPGHLSTKIAGHAQNILGKDQVNLALALAWAESNHRHCCKGRTDNKYCKGTQEESCKEEKLISSGSSFGVMQLNRGAHCAWFYPDKICQDGVHKQGVVYSTFNCDENYWKTAPQDCKIYKESGCNKADATNVDCSIKLSLRYLKSLHKSYSSGISEGKITCKDENTKRKYQGYKGWFAALRAYNGMGCPDKKSKAYVETVESYMKSKPWEKEEIKEKPSTLIKISLTSTRVEEDGELGVHLETSGICGDVEKYAIYRKTEKGEETKVIEKDCKRGVTIYKDFDIPRNKGKYNYIAVSLSDQGNPINKIESGFIEVIEPRPVIR